MDYSKPTLLVISGPNGAGKSTFAQCLVPARLGNIQAFDRDKVRMAYEKQLVAEGADINKAQMLADQLMEVHLAKDMETAINSASHFVLETPLSHPDYWRYLDKFEKNGYQIKLCYLCLDRVQDCEHRVYQRVRAGGHHVDKKTIKGVFEQNLKYINEYSETFRSIELYDGTTSPQLLAMIDDNKVLYSNSMALKKIWFKNGLPSIARKILPYAQKQHQTGDPTVRKRKRLRH